MVNPTFLLPLTGKRIVIKGVDAFDVALWQDAWRIDRNRLSWMRIRDVKERKSDTCDVRLEVSEGRYRYFKSKAGSAAAAADAIADELSYEAREIVEHDALRSELEAVNPIMLIDERDWLHVEWTLGEACEVVAATRGASNAQHVELIREGPVGRTSVRMWVCLPDKMRNAVMAMDKDALLSDRVHAVVMAEVERQSRRPAIVEDEIPF